MLIYKRTNILETPSQTVVNTVNCVGVMGKGLAQAFKKLEPDMFAAYKEICDQKLLEPGKLWLWRGSDRWILNFPTKIHWKNPSKLEWIEAGLQKFVASYEERGIREISFPRLGCGNGGLDWDDVRPVMEKHLGKLSIPVFIHDYTVDIGLPEHLEALGKALRKKQSSASTFDAFMLNLRQAIALSGSKLIDLKTQTPLEASVVSDERVKVTSDSVSWIYEVEDLRGVWLGLQAGIVTEKEAGWSVMGGGPPLISLLSVLPQVRPIQIQRCGSETPELAVEWRDYSQSTAIGSDGGEVTNQ